MSRTAISASILMATILVRGLFAADPVTRVDASRFQAKMALIAQNEANSGKAAARTEITETELNAYLQYEAGDRIPAGVKEPRVSLRDRGGLAGTATVDLAVVGKGRKSGGMLDPFSYLSGVLPVAMNGVLSTKSGIATFTLESASVSGVPMPAWMLQEIVSYYTKSDAAPNGVEIDKPFALPSGIREIQLVRGQAIVVQ